MTGPVDATTEIAGTQPPEEIQAVPVRHPGRWIAAAVVAVLIVALAHSVATNPRFQWGVVGHYLFTAPILRGLVLTLELTAVAMVFGIVLGVLLALMRLSRSTLMSSASWVSIWLLRGTPVLVQLLLWYFIAALYPTVDLGIPFGPSFIHLDTNSLVTKFVAATLALGLNEGAYMSEIVRAGIISVDEGQTDAAQALGMTRLQTMRRIVLPQAMRVIIPPTGNETISMLKTTSLVAFIALTDLLFSVQLIYARTYQTIALLIVASIWYLAATSVLSVGQYYIERYFGRGSTREASLTIFQRIRRNFWPNHVAVAGPPARADADVHPSGEDHR